jgi:hypothetical protein
MAVDISNRDLLQIGSDFIFSEGRVFAGLGEVKAGLIGSKSRLKRV